MKKLLFILKSIFIIGTVFFIFSCSMEEKEEQVETMPFDYTTNHHPPMSIYLSWPNMPGADEYVLFRSIYTSDNFTELLLTEKNHYTDNDISYNTIYFYKITARKKGKLIRENTITFNSPKVPDGLSSSDGFWLNNEYTDYSFPEGVNSLWFRLYSRDGNSLHIRDRVSSDFNYTADIVVSIFTYYQNKLTLITIDDIYQDKINYNHIYAYGWSGTYYVLVEPKNNDEANKGTFAISFF